jgi:predicted O-methyltransferase YrrM
MSPRTIGLTDALHAYLLAEGVREPAPLRRLREETSRFAEASMQIAPEQGQLMALLARLVGARRTLEIGTFTGYSALAVALALPADGKVIACEKDRAYAEMAKAHWASAGVADRIELRLGCALDTLEELIDAGEAGRFDIAFIDADKENYSIYYERCLELVRRDGLVLVDNVLWGGAVVDAADREPATEAIRAFNRAVHADPRVEMVLLPVGDGLTLARKIV